MEQRTLELELVSAKDLKDVILISKMDVYAVVSLDGDAHYGKQKTKTKVVRACGTNPTFNFPMRFTVDDTFTQQNRLSLQVKLVCERSLGDKDIGFVFVPVKELFDSADPKNMKFISYQVRRPSGKPKGELSFSYKFGEKVTVPVPEVGGPSAPAYGAYPLQATSSSGSGYPSPQPGYGYAPPPPRAGYPEAPPRGYEYPPQQPGYAYPLQQPGYGYPPPPPSYGYRPQQPGYGYPPVQQPEKKFEMGLSVGLQGGAFGGFLIGDVISNGGGGCGGGGYGGGGGCGGGGGGCGGGDCGGGGSDCGGF